MKVHIFNSEGEYVHSRLRLTGFFNKELGYSAIYEKPDKKVGSSYVCVPSFDNTQLVWANSPILPAVKLQLMLMGLDIND